jgi:hypothetical protein
VTQLLNDVQLKHPVAQLVQDKDELKYPILQSEQEEPVLHKEHPVKQLRHNPELT